MNEIKRQKMKQIYLSMINSQDETGPKLIKVGTITKVNECLNNDVKIGNYLNQQYQPKFIAKFLYFEEYGLSVVNTYNCRDTKLYPGLYDETHEDFKIYNNLNIEYKYVSFDANIINNIKKTVVNFLSDKFLYDYIIESINEAESKAETKAESKIESEI